MALNFSIEFTEDGKILISNLDDVKRERRRKGKSLLEIPKDYCIIDTETTGLDPYYDDIIEISALRVRDNSIVETYSTLVRPGRYFEIDKDDNVSDDFIVRDGKTICYVDSFITNLTGITNKMLENAPSFQDIQPAFIDFIGNDILIGHNVNFDINFLYDNLQESDIRLQNDYLDTLRLSKRLLPELPNHKLKTLAKYWDIDLTGSHRAEKDCHITYEILKHLSSLILDKFGTFDSFAESVKKQRIYSSENAMIKGLTTDKTEFDESHPCFGKEFVFTGKLDKMPRKDAMQLVIDLGGKCGSNVTKKTNFLVLGSNDYCSTIKDGKSNKQKKAEEYKLKGFDIEILSELVFYDMLEE